MTAETLSFHTPDTRPLASVDEVFNGTAIEEDHARQLRNEWIDNLLDPEHTLPQISIVEDPTVLSSGMPEPRKTGYRVYNTSNQRVGLFRLEAEPDPDVPGATIQHITWIKTERLRKGYGRAMYANILKMLPETATLVSHRSLQPGALKVWQWLESRQLAVKNPGQLQYDAHTGYIQNENQTPLFRSVVPNSQSLQKAYTADHL